MADKYEQTGLEPIAVVGMAMRYPGAATAEGFWANLRNGVESVRRFTDEQLAAAGVAPKLVKDPRYVKARAVLDGIDMFDASFFGFTELEARQTDPQHRLFLECAWEAMEDAGYDSTKYSGRIGVFGGCGFNSYLALNLSEGLDAGDPAGAYGLYIGNDKDFLSTRVAYKLNLTGPAVTVNSACSTSLVAVHLACQSLLSYQCDMALAGGSSVNARQMEGYLYEEGMILSPDGHCRAFDAKSSGIVPGSGTGIVALKRLEDALRDGDTVNAVILGSAVNNDGAVKAGYTAPSVDGQAKVISEAIAIAGVEPETISYVEAHGTGTPMGDPIEIAALTQAFGTGKKAYCAIGSVKTNIGHTDTAAGVAGLIKTALALKNREIPPSLNYTAPNPAIDFANGPFFVNARLRPWEALTGPRRAGVSSLGIGGTNAHVIMEQAPAQRDAGKSRKYYLAPMSAKTGKALETMQGAIAERLSANHVPIQDAAYTLGVGRRDFADRSAVVCAGADDAARKLKSGAVITGEAGSGARPVVFMFPGQGAQSANMARGLYETEPVFRYAMDECFAILSGVMDTDLKSILYPSPGMEAEAACQLTRTKYAQPALFAVCRSLAVVWRKWGVTPCCSIGHSVGEYVSAHLAGVFSLEDALKLVAARGRVIEKQPGGAMTAVFMDERDIAGIVNGEISIAAVNAQDVCVLSGPVAAVERIEAQFGSRSISFKRLHTSHAFHSAMMEPAVAEFEKIVRDMKLDAPRFAFISNVTGTWITKEDAVDPAYWSKHIRATVRFSGGVREIMKKYEDAAFLEAGPGRTLSGLVSRHGAKLSVACLPHPGEEVDDVEKALDALGRLWVNGARVDWQGFNEGREGCRVSLPKYPFEKRPYWAGGKASGHAKAALVKETDMSRWFYVPSWKRTPSSPKQEGTGDILVFTDREGSGAFLAARLAERGMRVTTVYGGEAYEAGDGHFTVRPDSPEDCRKLFGALGTVPGRIAHLWGMSAQSGEESVDDALGRGFYSLVNIVKQVESLGRKIEISVFTRDLWRVTGDENLRVNYSTVMGPVRSAWLENENISMRNIDFDSRTIHSKGFTTTALGEILSGSEDRVAAYRGRSRWVETFARLPLGPVDARPGWIRENGAYLVTGGLGAIGLAVAGRMAGVRGVKLILGGRGTLPPKSEWDGILAGRGGDQAARLGAFIAGTERRIKDAAGIRTIDMIEGFEERMNALCSSIVVDYLASCGVAVRKGSSTSAESVKATLGIIPKFEKFYLAFLRMLGEDSIIRVERGALTFLKDADEIPRSKEMSAKLRAAYPGFEGMLSILEHCGASYKDALSGKIEAISVLYPKGGAGLMESAVANTEKHTQHDTYISLLAETVAHLAAKQGGARILEFGGGNGAVTRKLVPLLRGMDVEYHFTDIGRAFTVAARNNAKKHGHDFMKFGELDISRDPASQGYEPGSFDVVFGLDVVHATPKIEETLRQVKKLLRPGGALLLVESTSFCRWFDMAWGLAEGWWYFNDTQYRAGSPLVRADKWELALARCGFTGAQAWPKEETERNTSGCAMITAFNGVADAREEGHGLIGKIQAVRRLESMGATVETLGADVADCARFAEALAAAEEVTGPVSGVIHAAGLEASGTICGAAAHNAAREFAPKIHGMITLDKYFAHRRLDFMVLFSSLSSVTGGAGQAGYAASNAYMDAYAQKRHASDGVTVSVNWDMWRGMGLARRLLDRMEKVAGGKLDAGMSGAQGVDAFERIMNGTCEPQVIVSTADIRQVIAKSKEMYSSLLDGAGGGAGRRPVNDNLDALSQTQRAVARIWMDTLGADVAGVSDNFIELGGDSLTAIRIVSRIRDEFGVEAPVRIVFERPTIGQFAGWIETAMGPSGGNVVVDELEEGEL
ncbi:MAG: acyltransferase domain-containing protein [Nitrospinae bacterium]|nr:acyltransferase domain-containing protein [Nitrospinota bacterium]